MAFYQDLQQSLGHAEVPAETHQGVDQAFNDMAEQEQRLQDRAEEESRVLSQVETRLYKANLYRAVLENPLFPEDQSEAAADVETEFREFTLARLNELMGITAAAKKKSDVFSEDEERVLKLWATKLLGKPTVIETKPVVMRPVTLTPSTQKPIVPAHVKVPPRKPTLKAKPTKTEPLPEGVVVEDGKKFVEVDRTDVHTGEKKKVRLNVTGAIKHQPGTNPAPTPAPAAALMLAVNQAAMTTPQSGRLAEVIDKVTKV